MFKPLKRRATDWLIFALVNVLMLVLLERSFSVWLEASYNTTREYRETAGRHWSELAPWLGDGAAKTMLTNISGTCFLLEPNEGLKQELVGRFGLSRRQAGEAGLPDMDMLSLLGKDLAGAEVYVSDRVFRFDGQPQDYDPGMPRFTFLRQPALVSFPDGEMALFYSPAPAGDADVALEIAHPELQEAAKDAPPANPRRGVIIHVDKREAPAFAAMVIFGSLLVCLFVNGLQFLLLGWPHGWLQWSAFFLLPELFYLVVSTVLISLACGEYCGAPVLISGLALLSALLLLPYSLLRRYRAKRALKSLVISH